MAEEARRTARNAEKRRAPTHPRARAPINHDDLVAQLTFENLSYLLPTKKTTPTSRNARATRRTNRENLWLHATINAFPNRDQVWPTGARGDTEGRRVCLGYYVGNTVERLRVLRNRVGHHEQTLTANHHARHSDALAVARAIDPDAAEAIADLSGVPTVLARRPRF